MGQLLISDMFSSQQSTPSRKVKAGSPELGSDFVSPYKINNIDAQANDASIEGVEVTKPSTDSQHSKPRGRIEVRIPQRSPLADRISTPPPSSISIPATPDAVLLSSQTKVINIEDGEELSVPETPPDTTPLATKDFIREASPSPCPQPKPTIELARDRDSKQDKPKTPNGKQIKKPYPPTPVFKLPQETTSRTPSRLAAVFKGDSPFNAIDVSSGVDTDCEITLVRVSPVKKKGPRQRAARSKNSEKRNINTSTPRSKDAEVIDRSKSEPPRARQPISTPQPVPSTGPTSTGLSSAPGKGRPAIKAKYLIPMSQPSDQTTPSRAVEKKQPSTEGNVRQSQQTPTKKQRINPRTPSSAPASIPTAIVIDDDTDTDDARHHKTPGITSLLETYLDEASPRPENGNDADGEESEMDFTPSHASHRKILQPKSPRRASTPQTTPSRRLFKTEATATPTSRTSLTPCKTSPVIDLTKLAESDDSDSLSDEDNFVTRLMPSAKLPRQHISQDIYEVPSDQAEQTAVIDRDADAKAIKQEHHSASDDDDVFYNAPELPLAEKSVSPVQAKARDYDARIIKQEDHLPSSSPVPFYDNRTGDGDFSSSPPSAQPQQDFKFLFDSPCHLYSSSEDESRPAGKTILKTEVDTVVDLSSPISYRSTSDSDGEVNFNIPDYRPFNSQRTHNALPTSRVFFRSDSDSDFDSDDSLQDDRPTPFDPYNMPRIGSGGFEPQPPSSREPTPYVLQPVYNGAVIQKMQKRSMSGNFKPRHRNILIGLKGILKSSQSQPSSSKGSENAVSFTYRPRPTTAYRHWRYAGLPFLLFKSKKKPLDEVAEEAVREEDARQQEREVRWEAEKQVLEADALKQQVKREQRARRAAKQAAKEAEERALEEEKKAREEEERAREAEKKALEDEKKAREEEEQKQRALKKRLDKAARRGRTQARQARKDSKKAKKLARMSL